ncbi:MAG: ATP-binding protein, partial [bacterium]
MTHQIRFADFELDLDLFQLKRSGCDVDLGPRALDLLACLISNRERVVSPERLRTEVWEGAALSASAIPTCVSELRRVLADDATQPRFIETVRSRGYRFIHPCESVLPDATRIGAGREGVPARIQLPFVGREADLEILREAFRESLQGTREGVVLLRGEAGIGKTRLLSEFLRGLPVDAGQLMAPSSPIEGSPPFWPWTRLVRRATADSRMTSDELLARVGELAAVFPEIDERIHSPPRPPCEIDRFSILGLWAKTIRCLLASRPLVLAFEDIHLLDVDSVSLMSWLAEELREEPLLILATHRPPVEDGPSARRLAELAASPQTILRDLSPLTAVEIARLLGDPSEDRIALSRVLRRRSAGNPFYLTHLLRDLASHEERCRSGSPASLLPLHGSEIVTRQLSNLPTRTRRALEAASVAGVRFSIEAVAELAGTTEEETLASLAPALRAMLVAQDELEYVFTHELLRDAIHGDLSPLARRELHLSMSRHLRARERPGSRTAEISDHLTAARPLGSAADVLEYAIRSAREAASRFAYSAAQSYFRRALKLLDDDPESAAPARGGLLLEYARSRLYSGEREEARSTLLEAATLARSSDSSSLLAECALQLAPDFLSIEMGFYDATLVELIEEALDLVPEDEPALRAQLLARLCQAKQWATPASDTVLEELSEQALSAAERSGEPRAIYAALEARADSLHGPDRVDERLDTIQELTHRGGRGQGGPAVILQHIRRVAALLELGDMGTLDAAIDACDEA